MEIQTVSASCVALLLHSGALRGSDAARLVRLALRLRGLSPWRRMELDLYPSGGDTLILARPAPDVRVDVADWLRPYIE